MVRIYIEKYSEYSSEAKRGQKKFELVLKQADKSKISQQEIHYVADILIHVAKANFIYFRFINKVKEETEQSENAKENYFINCKVFNPKLHC